VLQRIDPPPRVVARPAPRRAGALPRVAAGTAAPAAPAPPARSRNEAATAAAAPATGQSDTVENIRPISMLPVARSRAPNPPAAARQSDPAGPPATAPRPNGASDPAAPVARRTDPDPAPNTSERRSASTSRTAATRSMPERDATVTPARSREVAVLKTVWHPSPERRTARVSVSGDPAGREVREGDVVEGLSVREIKLSGVVFEREGVAIERRVSTLR